MQVCAKTATAIIPSPVGFRPERENISPYSLFAGALWLPHKNACGTGTFYAPPFRRQGIFFIYLYMTDLFSKVIDFANFHRAYKDARQNKRYRSSILKFGYHLEENLLALRRELITKTYRHGGYREFVVTDSKKRTIKAAPFRDRVVHHAVCNIIEPILDKGFIYDSYACRRGKGTHAAILRLESFIKTLSGTRERERERRKVPHKPRSMAAK